MAKTWATWLPDLLPQLPECPNIVAEHEVRRAAQVFFEKTLAWSVTLDAESVGAGEYEVELAANTGQEIVRVNQAWYDGRLLAAQSSDTLSDQFAENWQIHIGEPSSFVQETPGVVRLYPIPSSDSATGLVARVAVKPGESSSGIPDELAIKYRDAITAGAKGRLMLYVGKPWSNPDFGTKHESEFLAVISQANLAAATSSGRSRIPSKPRWC